MLKRFSIDFALFMITVDAALVLLSLFCATMFRPQLGMLLTLTKDFRGPYILSPWLYPIFAATWVSVLILFSCYDGGKNFRLTDELTSYSFGSLLASVTIAGLLYITFRDFSRALFGTFVLIAYILMLSARLAYRAYFRIQSRSGALIRRVLIIGAGKIGKQLAANIKNYPSLLLVGFLDDDPKKQYGEKCLGTLDNACSIVQKHRIDDVVMALPLRAYHRSNQLAIELHNFPVKVWVVPDYFALALNQAGMNDIAGIPMIDLRAPALNDYQRILKRAFDLLLCFLLLPILLPVMGLIVVVIRLDSPGPSLFRQARVGENSRIFEMFKFRTMVQNADELRHIIEQIDTNGKIVQDKTIYDPRITRAGSFLRRTSMDELPQIFNVLRGEMSSVGPRPEMPHLVDQYEPWQRARFAVPQGMTGWWQVNGRSDKPMNLNTEDDLYYVKNYSIWLDLKIIVRTIWVVLRRKGAY